MIHIPYGEKSLPLSLNFPSWEILEPAVSNLGSTQSQEQIVKEAMQAPIGSKPLWKLARGKKRAVIIVSDHTRPVPSRVILPLMLREIRKGAPDCRITLLVATGCHRESTKEELRRKVGDEIFDHESIVVHDCDDTENMITLGILPSGSPLKINGLAAEADLLVSEGFIEPHFFAGFSGGRKSVLPGICARETVMRNHCAELIGEPGSRAGNLGQNLIHQDMTAAARMAGLAYIVNVILDKEKRVVSAVAGDAVLAHEEGCQRLARWCGASPTRLGDVVITSNGGAPLDQNLYQAVKSMTTAEAAAAKNGTIIVCSECADGIGGRNFYEAMRDCDSPGQLLQEILTVKAEETVPDQWQYQILCRILEKHRVILVARSELRRIAADMKMEYAASLEEALGLAGAWEEGKHTVVIPDGVSTMIVPDGAGLCPNR